MTKAGEDFSKLELENSGAEQNWKEDGAMVQKGEISAELHGIKEF